MFALKFKKIYLFEVLFSEACRAQKNIITQKSEACLSNRKKLHDAVAFVGQSAQQEVFGRKILLFFFLFKNGCCDVTKHTFHS